MESLERFSALVTLIHEAALSSELWVDVLREIAAAAGATVGGLIVGNGDREPPEMAVSVGTDPAAAHNYKQYYAAIDPVVPIIGQMEEGSVVTEYMIIPRAALFEPYSITIG